MKIGAVERERYTEVAREREREKMKRTKRMMNISAVERGRKRARNLKPGASPRSAVINMFTEAGGHREPVHPPLRHPPHRHPSIYFWLHNNMSGVLLWFGVRLCTSLGIAGSSLLASFAVSGRG